MSGSNSGGSVTGTTAGGSVSGSNSGGGVAGHAISVDEMPGHSHPHRIASGNGGGTQHAMRTLWGGSATSTDTSNIGNTGGGQAHNHGFTNPSWSGSFTGTSHGHPFTNPSWSGSGSFSGTAMDFAVQYIDIILCSKN